MKLSTEEDVKIKIVLNYLKSLGFKEDELSFENSFHLDLGRSTYKVDTLEQIKKAQPRLDILVTRNNINLFVVEVKSDLITITKKEIEQATSYAKLVHPVAPFTIITNGKEFHIYYSLTRQEIKNNELKIIDNYKIALPDDYKYEALKNFIGYSKENFSIFFRNQVREGMKTLLGSKHEHTKKYIPELHIPREDFISHLRQFKDSDKSVFALLGESGSGKTCSLCNSALEFVDEGLPVFFYKSFDLVNGIIETISEDINWEFSPQCSEIEIFKRFDNLFSAEETFIFIDAIDEWRRTDQVESLSRFVSIISKRKIKLILSCKSNAWDEFLKHKGIPTETSQEIYLNDKDGNGYYLEPFSEKEFFKAVERYRKFYGFKGPFETSVLDECKKSAFFLRVSFEVAHKHQLNHLTFSSIELFQEYYNLTLEKVGNKEVADATLKRIAGCIFERNSDSIDIDSLRKTLGFGVNESLMRELFTYNILDEVDDGINRMIKFYFGRFRDYLISFHVKKWHEIDIKRFQMDFEQIMQVGVQQEALSFFYQFANLEKKKIVDGAVRSNAEEYLDFYVKVIDQHFLNLKNRFSPHTDGDIGFISEVSIPLADLGFFGFRALNRKTEERVKFIPVDNLFPKKVRNIMFLYGAERSHLVESVKGFKKLDIGKEVLNNEIKPQLKKIIAEGRLNEKNNIYLSLEKAYAIHFLLLSGGQDMPGIKMYNGLSGLLPINLNDIEDAIRYAKAYKYYENELIRQKREKNIIREKWDGSHVYYSYALSGADRDWIKENAHNAARNKIELKDDVRYTDLEIIESNLLEALNCLKDKGIHEISEKILPEKDATNRSGYIWDDYSPDTLIEFVFRLYNLFMKEYKIIIETNFPTLKNHFKLYSLMPIKVFLYREEHRDRSRPAISGFICKKNSLEESEVILCNKDELEMDWNKWNLLFKGEYHKVDHCRSFNVDKFFGGNKTYLKFGVPSKLATLRNLVYYQIESEFKDVIKALFNYYGVLER